MLVVSGWVIYAHSVFMSDWYCWAEITPPDSKCGFILVLGAENIPAPGIPLPPCTVTQEVTDSAQDAAGTHRALAGQVLGTRDPEGS